jgi:DNA mismatch endonuclease (patch repair protein)
MSRVRYRNTDIEIKLRKALFSKGYRYRLHVNLPGRPDIVLPKYKTVIFVNGCFWHQHNCSKGTIPGSNSHFWKEKLEKNKLRDRENKAELKKIGWNVIVVWECEILSDIDKVCSNIISALEKIKIT